MKLKGYKTRAYGWACVPNFEMLEVPLEGARFLTFTQLLHEITLGYAKSIADFITKPSPIWLMLKEKNLVPNEGTTITEPIFYR